MYHVVKFSVKRALWKLTKKKNGKKRAAARAFALALLELREQHKLKQDQLGIQPTYASALERGKHDPSLSTMYKVAPQFGLTYPELSVVIDKHYVPPKEA
jgi:DNA-binding XRE family transcriptional regulator